MYTTYTHVMVNRIFRTKCAQHRQPQDGSGRVDLQEILDWLLYASWFGQKLLDPQIAPENG